MKKTKVYHWGKYVGEITVDGKKYTKWQIFKMRLVTLFKRTVIASFLIGSIVGAFKIGLSQSVPVTVFADRVTEVPTMPDIPLLDKICKAESGDRQFAADGSVLRGKVDPSDIGYCQINEPTWNDQARKLGYDIYTQDGNIAMAQWLFLRYGSQPWNASKPVWSKM